MRSLLLLVALLLVLFTATAKANGPAGCSFSGTVKLDGADVAGGTLVTATIQGDEYHTHTPPGLGSSSYAITIQAPEGKKYPDGTVVTFKVNDRTADQTGIFQAGSSLRLDLTASSGAVPSDTPASAPGKMLLIVAVIIALLVAGGVTYYFLRRRRVNMSVIRSTRDGYLRGQQVPPAQHPRETAAKKSGIESQLRKPQDEIEPKLKQPITYSEGVIQALEIHGFALQRTTPVNLTIKCPTCHQRFTILVPDSWTVTRRAHLADGAPSYGKRTRTKLLFEFDLVCPEGHKLHLDWNWK